MESSIDLQDFQRIGKGVDVLKISSKGCLRICQGEKLWTQDEILSTL